MLLLLLSASAVVYSCNPASEGSISWIVALNSWGIMPILILLPAPWAIIESINSKAAALWASRTVFTFSYSPLPWKGATVLPETSIAITIAGSSPLINFESRKPLPLRSSNTRPWILPRLLNTSTVKVWRSKPPLRSATSTVKLTLLPFTIEVSGNHSNSPVSWLIKAPLGLSTNR